MEEAVKGKAKRRHLNAAECDELGQSAGALAQPNAANNAQSIRNHNPNKGLYPRTPTKRRKFASPVGSPSGKQTGIGDFFSVTGVIKSSPHKSPQASTSTHADGLNGELFPKEEPKKVVEDDEEDDDDISLLAAVLPAEPEPAAAAAEEEVEEDEVDDESLLAVAAMSDPYRKPEETVNYLEGITSEMFGDDDGFPQSDDEVEALPDTHYGLLGNKKDLLEPQGCIDDLPDEVLRQVLCQIPAQDLYRNVSLVCHRWRNIVQDPKFVPFKKQHYRYMMKEQSAEKEVFQIMMDSNIIPASLEDYTIRNLVIWMAQYKLGERVRPEDVLECVKRHRLFPQAEASIRLRISYIQKNFSLGLQGPNPYAAMAVILILSEKVDDVLELVSLLGSCMSETSIVEFLNHMAMMLLALKRFNILISNRPHYHIYYVLHLMENGPFSVNVGQSRQAQIHLTREQQQILSHDIQPNHVMKIVAFAGTGKTTTLVKYAEERPHLRFLYVAFNKSVATEAQRRFPSNVSCKTVHSLAFGDIGRRYHSLGKLTFNVKPYTINSVLPKGRGGYDKAKVVAMTLNTFMASTDCAISIDHVPSRRVSRKGNEGLVPELEKPLFVQDARAIWSKMTELAKTEQEAYYMTHDGYLKLWQLKVPQPKLSDQYDVLFIDEAQDCTPAIMDVLMSQSCGKILVGDPHQQIYTFKGAVNALNIVEHTHIYYLTQSFRFGAEIAYVGATILKVCKKVEKILVGGKQKGGVGDETAGDVREAVRMGVSSGRGKTAILCRCNLTVFSEAVRLIDANSQCRVHFVGGIKSIGLNRILDVWQLMKSGDPSDNTSQRRGYIRDPLIRFFSKSKNPFLTLKLYVKQTEDLELEAKLSIVEQYGKRFPGLVKQLEMCCEEDFNKADFIVGTVHKAKGLEFDTVMVSDDFSTVPASRHNLHLCPEFSFSEIHDDEWNLLYVAVTRAKTTLIITDTIRHLLTMAGGYYLKSVMPSMLQKDGERIPCTVVDCPNCITPNAAFVMCKQQIKCTHGMSSGGPLCERCVWTRIGSTAFLMTDGVRSMASIPRRLAPVDVMMFMGIF